MPLFIKSYNTRLNKIDLTVEDVLHLGPKFWRLQTDLLSTMDAGAYVLITIQYNLFIGTVASFLLTRPELQPMLESALRFDISLVFIPLLPRYKSNRSLLAISERNLC